MEEIYCRNPDEFGYNPNSLVTKDRIEWLLTKIRMILFTKPGEVLGQPDLGIDLEKYVFETYVNSNYIEKEIYGQLLLFVPEIKDFSVNVKVSFQKGEFRDQCFIDIIIDGTKYLGLLIK